MAHTKLKLHEYYKLEGEINGLANQQTGEKITSGLLNEKISFVTKYWLTDLSKKVTEEKTSIDSIKTHLIKCHGTEDENGNISIPLWINEEKDEEGNITSADPNPAFIKFQEDLNKLLEEEKTLEHHEFKLDEFKNIETTDNYSIFYKLIQID
jgi:hypothetical protein